MEVSAIASQLVDSISKNPFLIEVDPEKIFSKHKYIIEKIVESAALLHDIGNPPFGHFGEDIIRNWFLINFPEDDINKIPNSLIKQNIDILCQNTDFDYVNFHKKYIKDFYYFEGNAQALRIITKLHQSSSEYGMNLTAATINTIIKYSACSKTIDKTKVDKKKLGYFQAEIDILDSVVSLTGVNQNGRHPLTFILEAADDIAYITADIEDAIKKELFNLSVFKLSLEKALNDIKATFDLSGPSLKNLESLLKEIATNDKHPEDIFYKIRNCFISGVSYLFCKNYAQIMKGTYQSDLFHDGGFYEALYDFLKKFCVERIFTHKPILKLEIAGNEIISFLLDKFVTAVIIHSDLTNLSSKYKLDNKLISLISEQHKKIYEDFSDNKSENEKLYLRLLMITDFISGMTDSYAYDLYLSLSGKKI